ncbi:MAG: AEC family transporter [Acidaminococcus intestini]|uniref:AEC family transporter n=1 Tax=Acidaminococcus intestini TaxID=187327 RepID=A0A943EEB3_9FIRM|nr:AEC family transporter [Acidaminococcus intestini]
MGKMLQIFMEVLLSIFPIFAIIGIGYKLQGAHWFSTSFSSELSRLIMKIALPASIFTSVIRQLDASKLASFGGGLVLGGVAILLSYAVGFLLCRLFKVRHGRRGTFINTFANANTIFIGMPLNLALFGPQGESAFLAYYVLNTLSTWAFGSFLITGDPTESGNLQERNPKSALKQVLSPPLLAFFAALLLILGNVGIPAAVLTTTQYLGSLVTPLALLYIGIVLFHAGLASLQMDRDTALALVGKFAVAPFAMILVLMAAAQGGVTLEATEKGTFIMQSAVPALTVLPVLAHEGKGDVHYATSLVAFSTLLFAGVAPVLMLIIDHLPG